MNEFIETYKENNNFIIKISGRIEMTNISPIEKEVLEAIENLNTNTHLILEFSDLEYISSAGLRLIMLIHRKHPNFELINVNPGPYEVFNLTGFTEILSITKKKRNIDVSDLEKIGAGQTGATYRLDDETIVKVFHKGINEQIIDEERETAKKAFISGIPTAIPFDTVNAGDQLGIVYELIPSSSFLGKIVHDKDNLDQYAKEYGKFLHEANSIELNPKDWIDQKQKMLDLAERLATYTTPEQLNKIKEMVQNIPEGTTFIHGDAHPDNVLVLGDELVFIDMSSVGFGHHIFDLISFAGGVVNKGDFYEEIPDDRFDERTQLTWGERKRLWRGMLKGYFNTEDEEFLDRVEKQVIGRTALRNAIMIVYTMSGTDYFEKLLPNLHSKIQYALEVYDNLEEPIFF